jgi:inorganic pyrophosphatase
MFMSYSKVPAGKDLPNDIYVAIEIPANHAPIKYEIDKDSDCLFVDRFMATPMFYPANYGYIPNTLADDGDPLDVLVVTPYPVSPGAVIRARPVGVLHMTDEAGGDAKLIAVPHDKPAAAAARADQALLRELQGSGEGQVGQGRRLGRRRSRPRRDHQGCGGLPKISQYR